MARSTAAACLVAALFALALASSPARAADAAAASVSASGDVAAAGSASASSGAGANASASRPPLTKLDLQLRVAVEEDDEDAAVALVRKGASSIAKDEKGRTAISVAAGLGHEGVLAALLAAAGPGAAGAASLPDDGGMRALHIAAARGMEGCAAQLLKLGANASGVNARDKVGWTPLFHAADKDMGAIVSLLVRHGAELGVRDSGGANAFHYAASEGHIKALAPLIAAAKDEGAGSLARYLAQGDAKRYTPLHWAAQYGGGAPDAARMLLKAGAKVDARAVNRTTPLMFAASEQRMNLVRVLVEHGADMDAADATGSRPLHMAAAKGHEELVTWLLKFGVESDVPDQDGWTPLHFACIKPEGHLAAQALIGEGQANVSRADKRGVTPLHIACSHASGETARLLLRNGASGLVPDKSNRTALDMCEAVAPQWPTTRGANGAAVQLALSELRVNLAQVAHAKEIERKAFAEEAEAKAKAAAAAAANATGGAGQKKEDAASPPPPPPADAAAAAAPGPGGAAHPN